MTKTCKYVHLHLLQLLELDVLELLQCVHEFSIQVMQACVTHLVTHFPDVYQCSTKGLYNTYIS